MIVRDFDDMRIGTTPLSKLYYGYDLIWKKEDEESTVINNKISSIYLTNYPATSIDYREDGNLIVAAMEGITGSLAYHIFLVKVTNGNLSLWYSMKTSGETSSVAFSKNGEYLFIRNRLGNGYTSTFVYKITSTGIVRDTVIEGNLSTALSGTHRFKFSKDGNYIIAHGQYSVKFIRYLDGEFMIIHEERPRTIGFGDIVSSVCMSSDGTYGVIKPPRAYYDIGDIYIRTNENYSFHTTLSISTAATPSCCTFSPNDKFLVFGQSTSEPLIIFKNENGVFTRITDVDFIPTSIVRGITFSSDSKYMHITISDAPYVVSYSINGTRFKKLPNLEEIPEEPSKIAVSPDGKYITMIGEYAEIYDIK